MRVTVDRLACAKALKAMASKIVPRHSTKAWQQAVRLEAADGTLGIEACSEWVTRAKGEGESGHDQVVRLFVPVATPFESGRVLVPADQLADLFHELKGESLTLATEFEDGKVSLAVQSGGQTVRLHAIDGIDLWPTMNTGWAVQAVVKLDAGALAGALTKLKPLVEKQGGRYAFDSVEFKAAGTAVTLNATNGRAAGTQTLPATVSDAYDPTVRRLIEHKRLVTAMQIVKAVGARGEISLVFREWDTLLAVEGGRLQIELLHTTADLRWPDFGEVRSSAGEAVVSMPLAERDVADFVHAIKRASLMCPDHTRGVRVGFVPGRGVTLRALDPESGESYVHFAARVDGEPLSVFFNPKLLIDAVKSVGGDRVIQTAGPNRPLVIAPARGESALLMPINPPDDADLLARWAEADRYELTLPSPPPAADQSGATRAASASAPRTRRVPVPTPVPVAPPPVRMNLEQALRAAIQAVNVEQVKRLTADPAGKATMTRLWEHAMNHDRAFLGDLDAFATAWQAQAAAQAPAAEPVAA
jgi:DNA polymerase III sliding clamp (beta) subunit (PCNA family)